MMSEGEEGLIDKIKYWLPGLTVFNIANRDTTRYFNPIILRVLIRK